MGGAAGQVRGVAQGLLASRGVTCNRGKVTSYYGEKEDEKLIVLSGGGGLTVSLSQ